MAITPPGYIEAPDPGRLRYGLFTASPPMEAELRGGFIYDTDYCATADLTQVQCVASAAKTFDDDADNTTAQPFAVLAGIQCGKLGYSDEEYAAKARARLAAGEQGAVELAVWTGLTEVGGDLLDIESFNTNPTVVAVTDFDNIVHVVAKLEEFAYLISGYGYEAYIHAPVEVAAFAAAEEQVVQDGDLKRTPYGSIWVFGGGYPGTDGTGGLPAAGGVAMYVTGKVNVWRSPDVFIPDVSQTFDRETNQQYVLAEREYAVGFDCLLGEANFQFPATA